MSCSRTGVPPVSDLDARFGRACGAMAILAACVLECASPLALSLYCHLSPVSPLFNSSASSLMKPIEGYSSLLKPIFKNLFFVRQSCLALVPAFQLSLSNFCQPMPAYAKLRQPMPATPPGGGMFMNLKLSSIANHRPCHSPPHACAPNGRGLGVRENHAFANASPYCFPILTPEFWPAFVLFVATIFI
jgi:hypothetical protein